MGIAPPAGPTNDLSVLDFDPAAPQGSVYFKGPLLWTFEPPGTVGDVWSTGGVGADPSWITLPGGGDMLVATYDPTAVAGNAFDFANMRHAAEVLGDMTFRGAIDWERLPLPSPAAEQVLTADSITSRPVFKVNPHPTNYVDGLNLSVPTVASVAIAVGKGRTDNDAVNFTVAAPITVAITASGVGGLDTGVEAANTWYDVYVIVTALGVVNGLLVISGNVPVLPGGFLTKRRVGVVRNDNSSNLITFLQTGSGRDKTYIYLNSLANRAVLIGGTATVASLVSLVTLVPPTTQLALLTFDNGSNNRTMDVYQDVAGVVLETVHTEDTRSILFPTDSAQRIAYKNSGAAGDANISVRGYVETL